MGLARDLTVGKKRTVTRALRAPYQRLRQVLFDPAATVEELTAALQACDNHPERRRIAEGIVYDDALRRFLMVAGVDYHRK